MRKHAGFPFTPLVFLFVVIVSLLALTPQARAANAPCLVRESLQVMRVPSGFEVRAKAVNPGSARTGASLEVQITDLEGGPVARISNQIGRAHV